VNWGSPKSLEAELTQGGVRGGGSPQHPLDRRTGEVKNVRQIEENMLLYERTRERRSRGSAMAALRFARARPVAGPSVNVSIEEEAQDWAPAEDFANQLAPALLTHFAVCTYRTLSLRLRKYLVILSMVIFSSSGDALLARGVKQVGSIDVHHLGEVFSTLANPFVIVGILFLLGFMYSYMTALSFADLSYVLPATAVSYIFMVLLSIVWLREHVSLARWAGVAFIVVGVGFVAGGPIRTEHHPSKESEALAAEERV
jgi:uncharacterized membrane protein